MVSYLVGEGMKRKDIDVDLGSEDLGFTFKSKGLVCEVYIEGPEDVCFSVCSMDGVDIPASFWQDREEWGDYTFIEEFYRDIVEDGCYSDVKKVWRAFERLSESVDRDLLLDVAGVYFDL
jgi:hypothetical protein